jgi:hypothetical protein
MNVKQIIAFFISLLLVVSVLVTKSTPASARNYAVQLRDEQDVENDCDLRMISMKDDFDSLYIKLDSWKNWNLESSNCYIAIFLSITGDHSINNSQFLLIVIEDGQEYFGVVYNPETDETIDVSIDFKENKNFGTIQVNKNLIKMKSSILAFQFYTFVKDNPGYYYDAAPDDQLFADYTPGPNTEKPMLDVSSINIQVGDIKKNDTAKVKFNIMNKGEGSVKATLTASANIRLDMDKITLGEYETDEVTIYITANQLEPKSYLETIDVKSDFGSYSINVSFYILPEPKLEIDVVSIDFGKMIIGEKKLQKITISNKIRGPIQVSLSTNDKWIILSKSSFESNSEEIIVSISTKTMEAGLNEGKIKVTSNGGSAIITVTAEILLPVSIDKNEFDFGEINLDDPKIEPIPFTLTNQTDSPITLKITSSEPWISIGSEIKIASKETKELKVAIKLDKMETVNKSYLGTITFESKYDKIVIPVKAYLKQDPPKTLWVSDPPDQKLVEEKIITGKTWEKLFTIKNDGSGVMEVQGKLEDSKTEFRLFNPKFTLKKGETADIKIKIDSTGLKLGTYRNSLIIESNGGNLTIPITIEVQPKPEVVIKLFIGLSFAYIDQEQITLEASPYISKGTTMVPLRFISEAFKAKIEWFPLGKGRIILSVPSKTIQLDIGENFAFINGDKLPLQTPPEIKSGRTFVPVRFIAEGLGARIEWKADTQQITIYYIIEE